MCDMILDRCQSTQSDYFLQRLDGLGSFAIEISDWDPAAETPLLVLQYQARVDFQLSQPGQREGVPVPLDASNGTESVWLNGLARGWLSSCQSEHHECRRQYSPDIISNIRPSRLLELSSTERLISLRVRKAQELTKSPLSYCTLSHCWGGKQPLRLTKELLTSFEHQIPFAALPKTFADAIQITLNLSQSYLWIDSLCICQDDEDDWLAESAKMADIYSNATCNLAAMAAKNSYEGCCTKGPTLVSRNLHFSAGGKSYMTSKLRDEQSYYSMFDEARLGKRGWVFQEIQLSPRTIFYGDGRIFWACITHEADEAKAMRLHYQERSAIFRKSVFARSQSRDFWQPSSSPQSLHDMWNRVVQEYTSTELTYASDRWVALAGLAARYMQITGQTLVAGLHWDHLLDDLSWQSRSPAGRLLNGAPTWSWLSCRSAVWTPNEHADELLVAMVALPDKNMRKNTWHVLNEPSDRADQPMSLKCYPLKISGHVRSFAYMSQGDSSLDESTLIKFSTFSMRAYFIRLDLPLEPGTKIRGVLHSYDSSFIIILLAPAVNHGNDCWHRIGICHADVYGCKTDSPDDFESLLHAYGPVEELTIV